MDREMLKQIDRFLTFGDIKAKVDETDYYYITDKAMQKVIKGLMDEKLELERKIIIDRLIEIKERNDTKPPAVACGHCVDCKYYEYQDCRNDNIEDLIILANPDKFGCVYFEDNNIEGL